MASASAAGSNPQRFLSEVIGGPSGTVSDRLFISAIGIKLFNHSGQSGVHADILGKRPHERGKDLVGPTREYPGRTLDGPYRVFDAVFCIRRSWVSDLESSASLLPVLPHHMNPLSFKLILSLSKS
jgi:hypothetical protein